MSTLTMPRTTKAVLDYSWDIFDNQESPTYRGYRLDSLPRFLWEDIVKDYIECAVSYDAFMIFYSALDSEGLYEIQRLIARCGRSKYSTVTTAMPTQCTTKKINPKLLLLT